MPGIRRHTIVYYNYPACCKATAGIANVFQYLLLCMKSINKYNIKLILVFFKKVVSRIRIGCNLMLTTDMKEIVLFIVAAYFQISPHIPKLDQVVD